MELKKSNQNIVLGKDYCVWFADKRLTLDKGFMRKGGLLPTSISLVNTSLEIVSFKIGKNKTILTVPSLDTPVCELQVKSLSNDLNNNDYDEDHEWYVISVDTPFAQARFIKENDINKKITFLSDYSDHQFMSDSGLRIKELNLYSRAVITCDKKNVVLDVVIPLDITHLP
ncbi:redoxin family protein [Citrobacter freundii]|uniref:redoxin family protein n=1 Tax=Citrobacter freundii TaxID=546 RepID=UPI001EEF89EF|nr:redoxin family protein [Citrobacter freundii]